MLCDLFPTFLIGSKKADTKVLSVLRTSYILVSQLQKCMVEKPSVYSNIFQVKHIINKTL